MVKHFLSQSLIGLGGSSLGFKGLWNCSFWLGVHGIRGRQPFCSVGGLLEMAEGRTPIFCFAHFLPLLS